MSRKKGDEKKGKHSKRKSSENGEEYDPGNFKYSPDMTDEKTRNEPIPDYDSPGSEEIEEIFRINKPDGLRRVTRQISSSGDEQTNQHKKKNKKKTKLMEKQTTSRKNEDDAHVKGNNKKNSNTKKIAQKQSSQSETGQPLQGRNPIVSSSDSEIVVDDLPEEESDDSPIYIPRSLPQLDSDEEFAKTTSSESSLGSSNENFPTHFLENNGKEDECSQIDKSSPEDDWNSESSNNHFRYSPIPPGNYRAIVSTRRRYDTGSPIKRDRGTPCPMLCPPPPTGQGPVRYASTGLTQRNTANLFQQNSSHNEKTGWQLEGGENGVYIVRKNGGASPSQHSNEKKISDNVELIELQNHKTQQPVSFEELLYHPMFRDPNISDTEMYIQWITRLAKFVPLPPAFGFQQYKPFIHHGQPQRDFFSRFCKSNAIIFSNDKREIHCHKTMIDCEFPNPPLMELGKDNVWRGYMPYSANAIIRALQLLYGMEERNYHPLLLEEYIELMHFYSVHLVRQLYNHVFAMVQTWPFSQQVKFYVATTSFMPMHNIYLLWCMAVMPRSTQKSIDEYNNIKKTSHDRRYKFENAILHALQIK